MTREKIVTFRAVEFETADEAVQHTHADGRGVAIRVAARNLVVDPADADRLAAAGIEFAYLCDHETPRPPQLGRHRAGQLTTRTRSLARRGRAPGPHAAAGTRRTEMKKSTEKSKRSKSRRPRATVEAEREPEVVGDAAVDITPAGDAKPKARRAKKVARPAGDAKPKRVSALDAAAEVLRKAGQPMRSQDMIVAMAEQGLWTSPAGKTPHATLYAAILREIGAKGDAARFKKVDRGQFAAVADAKP